MDLFKLSDEKLAALHESCASELRRRVKANGSDPLAIIKSNEMGKRALTVAMAGNHSILFVGPPNCGKSMLRAAAVYHCGPATYEARPCPCGHHGDPRVECTCTARQIEKHRRKIPVADITVEICPPPERELNAKTPGTTWKEMSGYIERKTAHASLELDDECRNLLKAACAELGIDAYGRERILAVARTIANLDQSKDVAPAHLCEAINYRSFRR